MATPLQWKDEHTDKESFSYEVFQNNAAAYNFTEQCPRNKQLKCAYIWFIQKHYIKQEEIVNASLINKDKHSVVKKAKAIQIKS